MTISSLMLAATLVLGGPEAVVTGGPGDGGNGMPLDAVTYIEQSLAEYAIVALGEGNHATREPHAFLRRVLTDEGVLRATDIIIVEFATALHQSVLDAYIGGEEVPFYELSPVWRNTSTSPVAPWDSPVYRELLAAIREANLALPEPERVRVLAGDPPFDWGNVRDREDFERAIQPRNPYVARLAMEQAFGLGKKVLIVFGGAHLPRVPVGGQDDLRNSLSCLILKEHPGSMRVIGFLNPENLGITDRMDELVAGAVYPTDRHWVGDLAGDRFFRKIYSRVTDPDTGEETWRAVPLYSGYKVRDLFDALVYIGPTVEWHVVPVSLDDVRDADYLRELERRRQVRFDGKNAGGMPGRKESP